MRILVLNRGSSSVKCYLYDFKEAPRKCILPLWEAHLQWKNSFEGATLKIKDQQGTHSEPIKERSAGLALQSVMKQLGEEKIDVIGHRIVHGGKYFHESVLITSDVKSKINLLSEFAPLHNLPELEGIEILEKLFENTPQVAVFDTAFHHTLPQSTVIYPGPYRWYEEGIQRYGFHGISFQYCSRRGREILNQDLKMVICHLGSGASLCAVKEGKSLDTTMGFTPLDGLMMDTRPGSLDPGILLHLLKHKSPEEISAELYKHSGLLGVSGISSDMRDIIEKSLEGNERASIALEVYLHRLAALIGSMVVSLQGMDVLVFTGGIGENASIVREKICATFSFLEVKLDTTKNADPLSEDSDLSTPDSKTRVLLIHTQEAFEIAKECWELV